jgi:predicted DNA-binding transcriptional regulator AlpA
MARAHDHSDRGGNTRGQSQGRRQRLTHSERNPSRPVHAAGSTARLLTVAEVLFELQVARSTFDTWRQLGTAPECIKLPNGQIRVRRCALDSWLSSHSDKEAS